jgi:hypothetical protein
VKRAAHQPADDERALLAQCRVDLRRVRGRPAGAQSEPRRGQILRLNREEVADGRSVLETVGAADEILRRRRRLERVGPADELLRRLGRLAKTGEQLRRRAPPAQRGRRHRSRSGSARLVVARHSATITR